ncbi:required for excision 1-B domain-containing protein isoform X2 [Stegostoma tigrinum]|uniref:required for excision 1-B domain-containing protein isoform X2 n=1 Tax=Stegostoma tigrinum TaxID=3053191 RepID=UPI00202B10CC|nr:required for excision 1-B domain-containing protein isoform X2 [Stegostoma tigrinum]
MMLLPEDQAIESSGFMSWSPSGGRMGASGLNTLVRTLYALQEERVEAYRLFDLGHQAYLRSAPNYDFIKYRQLVHEITQAFNRISKEVIQLKDRFHEEYDRPDLSEHIERVQEREREKLELTARLQLAKQNMLDHPGNETYQEEVQELKHRQCPRQRHHHT